MTKNNTKSTSHAFVILAYKESPFLEDCIKSAISQSHQSEVVIATTTPNNYIQKFSTKYDLKVILGKHTDIGGDFDFALNSANTDLVTVAHQDDIYNDTYAENILNAYEAHPSSTIIFTDYYEIRGRKNIYTNKLLKFKRLLLTPIRIKKSLKSTSAKRLIIRFGNSICCPAVTIVKKSCPKNLFSSHFDSNVDWHAWETLTKKPGAFTFVNSKLVGHRISKSSTTTAVIKSGIRTKEDYEILCRFWPKPIAKIINKLYSRSKKSNSLD